MEGLILNAENLFLTFCTTLRAGAASQVWVNAFQTFEVLSGADVFT